MIFAIFAASFIISSAVYYVNGHKSLSFVMDILATFWMLAATYTAL